MKDLLFSEQRIRMIFNEFKACNKDFNRLEEKIDTILMDGEIVINDSE